MPVNFDTALNFFEAAISKDPNLAEAYHYKGRVSQSKLDFARAAMDYNMAIKLDSSPNSNTDPKKIAEHWNYAGQCYYELGQYEDALRFYESAVKKDN